MFGRLQHRSQLAVERLVESSAPLCVIHGELRVWSADCRRPVVADELVVAEVGVAVGIDRELPYDRATIAKR
jgi:hypothetical protein